MKQLLRTSLILFACLTVITGVVYPLIVTGIGHAFFEKQATGSLIEDRDQERGSALIGQQFTSDGYFWSRPSATGPYPYNALASSGSNLGPLNPALADAVRERMARYLATPHAANQKVPVELVTASASGLDPDISPAAALFQVQRVAQARGIDASQLEKLVNDHLSERQWGLLGEPRVNVLRLNLALDATISGKAP